MKKWCLAITEKNREVLHNWKLEQPDLREDLSTKGWLLCERGDGSYLNYKKSGVPNGYEEISYGEFLRNVLKKEEYQIY